MAASRPTALVTGASGGIGEALALRFAWAGYDLIIVARSAAALEAVAAQIKTLGAQADVIAMDLAEPGAGEGLETAVRARGLRVDVLANNAGFGGLGPFLDQGRDEALGMIDLNVRVLTELTHRFVGAMKAGGFGEGVINVASVAAFQPGPQMAVYYATKAYVLSFTEALNQELRGTPLHATALCPGPVATGFQARAAFDDTVRLMKLMRPRSAQDVADAAFDAFKARRPVVIPGLMETIMAKSAAFTPRAILLPLVEQIQKRGAH